MRGIQVIGSGSLNAYFNFDGDNEVQQALEYDTKDNGLVWKGLAVLFDSIYGDYQLKFSLYDGLYDVFFYQTITIKDSAPIFATEIGNFTLQVTADGAASDSF